MAPFRIYAVDDEESIREGIELKFGSRYEVATFPAAEPALEAIKRSPPDLVLLDLGLPGMDGLAALQAMRAMIPDLLVIVITAYEDVGRVISVMKAGAWDYVIKPIQTEALDLTVRRALDTIRLKKEVQGLQRQYLSENVPVFIGESDTIQDVIGFVETVAKSPDTPVLIQGETGTGKEFVAGAIHYRSPNFRGPFVSVNCAAIPKDLIESELFGYEKGAFTGAKAAGKKGMVEEAAGGTLFLDEVGDLCLEAQAKLLRFLEGGDFYRVGGTRKITSKTRVVSATNKDLEQLSAEGLFRTDLYYRLAVVKVQVPSLSDHREDILPIALHFLVEFSGKFGKTFTGISPEARELLLRRRWKGNVRELRNLVERGALVGKGPELNVEDLGISESAQEAESATDSPGIRFPPLPHTGIDLPAVEEALARHYIGEALSKTSGNETQAALLLGLNYNTFRYRRRRLE
jgi:DNA-binding NtrC family response regulator